MKKLFTGAAILLSAIIATPEAKGQMPYNVTSLVQPYTPLTGATHLNSNSDSNYSSSFSLPLGFSFRMQDSLVSSITLIEGGLITAGNGTIQSGFGFMSASLADRGFSGSASLSPIRYSTTGAAGSRIFKLELFNAGFADESSFGTALDSLSMQVWLYETSNVAEIRFGGSRVSHFNEYFGDHLFNGYIRNIDLDMYDFERAYLLTGNPAAPGLDSITAFTDQKGLNTMPAAGTVFRYTPKANATAVTEIPQADLAGIYPMQCSSTLTIVHQQQSALGYRIISMQGNTVSTGNAAPGKTDISVTDLPSGSYIIRLSDGAYRYDTRKFIKL